MTTSRLPCRSSRRGTWSRRLRPGSKLSASPNELREGPTRRVCAVGDVGPAEQLIAHSGGDPFREVAPVLRSADLSFANLETPLLPEIEPQDAHFAAPVRAAELLATTGFGLLNLANNHIADRGAEGLADDPARP